MLERQALPHQQPEQPDSLTPRQWQVLRFIREGLSHNEIAARLETHRDEVRRDVSDILSWLGPKIERVLEERWPEEIDRSYTPSLLELVNEATAGLRAFFRRRLRARWLLPATGWIAGMAFGATVSLLALLLAACGGDAGEPAATAPQQTATERPTSLPPELPFEIIGPVDWDVALGMDDLDVIAHYVLDLPTGQFYVIKTSGTDARVNRLRSVRWLDDETLLVRTTIFPSDDAPRSVAGPSYRARLDGTAILTPPNPMTPPNWQAGVSAPDGTWTATLVEGPIDGAIEDTFGTLLVGRPNEDPSYRLTPAGSSIWGPRPPAWSLTGHLLAFIGNVCREFDLFIFEPELGELRNLTATLENPVLSFAWRPDGSSLAASILQAGEEPSALQLVDLATGTIKTLVESPELGMPWPLGWNPSGDRLLFGFSDGGWCEGVGFSIPSPPPTTLEILGD